MTAFWHPVELRFYDNPARTRAIRDDENPTRTSTRETLNPHTIKMGVWSRPHARRATLRYVDEYPGFVGSTLDRLRDYAVRFDQAIVDAPPQSIDLHDGAEIWVVHDVQQVNGSRNAHLLLTTELRS